MFRNCNPRGNDHPPTFLPTTRTFGNALKRHDTHDISYCTLMKFIPPLSSGSDPYKYPEVAIPTWLFFFFFWPHCTACRILVPQAGIKPSRPATDAWSPNHWTSRDFPLHGFLKSALLNIDGRRGNNVRWWQVLKMLSSKLLITLNCSFNCLLYGLAIVSWTFFSCNKLITEEYLKSMEGASLVAQWLRICLPMQGTQVPSLAQEDPTCRGATKPVCHNYWACALESTSHNYWSLRA